MKRPIPCDVISDDSSDAENDGEEDGVFDPQQHQQFFNQHELELDSPACQSVSVLCVCVYRDDNQDCRNVSELHAGASHPITPWLRDSVFFMDGAREVDEATLRAAIALPNQHHSQTLGPAAKRHRESAPATGSHHSPQ
ncbi:unnamed protein product [Linum tenue]|uniref:Uncharacterized protein n=1 Tax=Linum tenue TaxID=586396 RepID=A0AAV0P5R2_9ROSI|nr:unnamed protein product [Linum tenue]